MTQLRDEWSHDTGAGRQQFNRLGDTDKGWCRLCECSLAPSRLRGPPLLVRLLVLLTPRQRLIGLLPPLLVLGVRPFAPLPLDTWGTPVGTVREETDPKKSGLGGLSVQDPAWTTGGGVFRGPCHSQCLQSGKRGGQSVSDTTPTNTGLPQSVDTGICVGGKRDSETKKYVFYPYFYRCDLLVVLLLYCRTFLECPLPGSPVGRSLSTMLLATATRRLPKEEVDPTDHKHQSRPQNINCQMSY